MNRFLKLLFLFFIVCILYSQTTTTFFKYTSLTGSNHIIGLPANLNPNINGVALASGDEIGVFTSDGLCVGATVWKGVATSIVAWADNPQTPKVDGFKDGGTMYFRVYSKSAKKQYYATVEYGQAQNNSTFVSNGFSLLKSLKGTNVVSVENLSKPENYYLSQNYPNPFNPSTKISFSIPNNSYVKLTIYDLNGKEINRLTKNSSYSAGTYTIEWNGKDDNGNNVSSGLYFYRLEVIDLAAKTQLFSQVKSMLLLK